MKVTRSQIRKILAEQQKIRYLMGHSNSEQIISEGVLDFLKDMWGKASEFFSGAVESVTEKFSEIMKDIAEQSLEKNKEDSDDEDFDDEEIESLSDLDPKGNEKHRKLYFKSISSSIVKAMEKAAKELASTSAVKNWTPKSNSSDDLKAWMKENKDSSMGLWRSVGGVKASIELISNSGAKFDAPESPKKNANPGEAIKYILSSCKAMKKVWEKMSAEVKDESKKVIDALSKVEAAAGKVGKAISDSANKKQNESKILNTFETFVIETVKSKR